MQCWKKYIFLILSIIRGIKGINYFNVLIEQRLKSYKGQILKKKLVKSNFC